VKIKLQSAMEYLMTYGWAILVIAVVMVALFSLGILGGGSPFGTTCLAQSGYVCSSPTFSASSGTLYAKIGQATGSSWVSANFVFVPSGTTTSTPLALFSAANINTQTTVANADFASGLITEQTVQANIYVVGPEIAGANTNTKIGQTYSGTLWAQYTTSATSPYFYAQVATVTLKAA
jgi:hypothetical protein